jgi:hypothetical protein
MKKYNKYLGSNNDFCQKDYSSIKWIIYYFLSSDKYDKKTVV